MKNPVLTLLFTLLMASSAFAGIKKSCIGMTKKTAGILLKIEIEEAGIKIDAFDKNDELIKSGTYAAKAGLVQLRDGKSYLQFESPRIDTVILVNEKLSTPLATGYLLERDLNHEVEDTIFVCKDSPKNELK